MEKYDIYCYGMITRTFAFVTEKFPVPDEYMEISRRWDYFGGETGTCAAVLSSLGASVKMDGVHIGGRFKEDFCGFFRDKSVDISSVTFDSGFEGLSDYVIITGDKRTPLGSYGHFYEQAYKSGVLRWNIPKESDIARCTAAAVDPFFGKESELAAEYCVKHGKPYVTIDCTYDSFIHKNAAVTVISGESIKSTYSDKSPAELLPLYLGNSKGLTIITNGGGEFIYGRGDFYGSMKPYKVNAVSTLGAGDTFKAGCVYGLLKGMPDRELADFAAACAGLAVSVCPLHENLPTFEEVQKFRETRETKVL
ncbi:MAG: carbohydrate kinase family protein [Ruminococcus sp.]|nr:carbohydrate kinase family protein [Ruminococcus sp.]